MRNSVYITLLFLIFTNFSVHAIENCVTGVESSKYRIVKTEHTILYPYPVVCKPQLVAEFTVVKDYIDPDFIPQPADVDYSLNWSKEGNDLWHVTSYEVKVNDDSQISVFNYDQVLPVTINLPIPGSPEGLASFEIRACSALPGIEPVCGEWQPTETQCEISCTDSSYEVPQIVNLPQTSSTGDFTVNWSAGGYSDHELQQSIGVGNWEAVQDGVSLNRPFINQSNELYKYRVRTHNGNIYSKFSEEAHIGVELEIPVIESLSPVRITGNYTVKWSHVGYDDSDIKYQLEQKKDSESWETVFDNRGYSLEFNNQEFGSTYQYRIKACRPENNCSNVSDTSVIEIQSASVSTLNVYQDINTNLRSVHWTMEQTDEILETAITHYKLQAFELGENNQRINLRTHYIEGAESRSYMSRSIKPEAYSVQACDNQDCGPEKVTNSNSFNQGLTRPHGVKVVWLDDTDEAQFRIKFKYSQSVFDNNAVGGNGGKGKPDQFVISPNFNQAGAINNTVVAVNNNNGNCVESSESVPCDGEQDWWYSPVINKTDIIGKDISIRACRDDIGCWEHVNYRLEDAITSDSLTEPEWVVPLTQTVSTYYEIKLEWSPNVFDDPEVDYIQIEESQPVKGVYEDHDDAPRSQIITYYSENESGMVLERLVRGDYEFKIKSCHRDRDNGDECSDFAKGIKKVTLERGEIDQIINPNVISFVDVINPDRVDEDGNPISVPNTHNIIWEDPDSVPDYYRVTATGSGLSNCIRRYGDKSIVERDSLNQVDVTFYSDGSIRPRISPTGMCPFFGGQAGTVWNVSSCFKGIGCNSQTVSIEQVNYLQTVGIIDLNDELNLGTGTQTGGALQSESPVGGPGDMRPGVWWNPQLSGTGWHFYWASELRYPKIHKNYGDTYDLIGVWLAYELINGVWSPTWKMSHLKSVEDIQGVAACNFKTETYFECNQFFEGDLTSVTLINGELSTKNLGRLQVYFEAGNGPESNLTALLNIDLDSKDGLLTMPVKEVDPNIHPSTDDTRMPCSDSNDNNVLDECMWVDVNGNLNMPLFNYDQSILGNPILGDHDNDINHYSGMWFPPEDNSYSLMIDIVNDLEWAALLFYDEYGISTWALSDSCLYADITNNIPCVEKGEGEETFEFITIKEGFDPLNYSPKHFWNKDNNIVFIGDSNDNGSGRKFNSNAQEDLVPEDFIKMDAWINVSVDLPGRNIASVSSGTSSTPTALLKNASFHDIRFTVNSQLVLEEEDEVTCDPSVEFNRQCNIAFTWFTDDDFPDIKPFFKKDGGALTALEDLCERTTPSGVYVETEYPCNIDDSGSYVFELRKPSYENSVTNINNWVPIAKSKKLTILPCDTTDCQTIPPGMGTPEELLEDPDLKVVPTLPSVKLTNDPTAGPVAGSAGVSGGAASFQLPIVIPPGRNGMTPSIGVNYSSKGSNGLMGVGWSMSAGSSINNCPATIAQGETYHAVDYSEDDRLCLDGQRLIQTNQLGYWDDGAVYRTEQDSFVQVTKISDTTFEVINKSGKTSTYTRKVDGLGASWYITEERDQKDNTIVYKYIKNTVSDPEKHGTNEVLIDEILYTGYRSSAGNRKIVFGYETRGDDYSVGYHYGVKTESTKRLKKINTYIGNTHLRKYKFVYRNSLATGNSLITSATETAYDGTQSITKNLFVSEWTDTHWDNEAGKYSYTDIKNSVINAMGNDVPKNLANLQSTIDFNGDGIKELTYGPKTINDNSKSGLVFLDKNGNVQKLLKSNSFANLNKMAPGDLNVDGINDFMKLTSTGTMVLYSWKVGTPLDPAANNLEDYFNVVPINSLALNQAFMDSLNWEWDEYDNSPPSNCPADEDRIKFDNNQSRFFINDYDNDGKSDVLVYVQPKSGSGSCAWNNFDLWEMKSKLVWFKNETDSDGIEFAPPKVIIEKLEPKWDREREAGGKVVIYYDSIEDISDFNGDGYLDFEIKRLMVGGDNGSDIPSIAKIVGHHIYFSDDSMSNPQKKSFTELGLINFKCLKQGEEVEVDCYTSEFNDEGFGSGFGPASITFEDVNGDGLKDLLYFDRGIQTITKDDENLAVYDMNNQIVRSWKVRLNKGGDVSEAGSSVIFESTSINSAKPVASHEQHFLPQSDVCDNLDGLSGAVKSRMYRICDFVFRTGVKKSDLNADGSPELLFPNPDRLVFNRCRITGGLATLSTQAVEEGGLGDLCATATINQYSVPDTTLNASVTDVVDACYVTQQALMTNALLSSKMDNTPDISYLDTLFQNEGRIIPGNQGLGCLEGGCYGRPYPEYPHDPEGTPVDPELESEGLVYACSKGKYTYSNGGVNIDGFDLYEHSTGNGLSLNGLWDRGVYEYSALNFSLTSDGMLNVVETPQTGLYSTLFWGQGGDHSSDGLSDFYAPVGCFKEPNGLEMLGCEKSELLDTEAMGGIYSQNTISKHNNGHQLLITRDELLMPDMIYNITWGSNEVNWHYEPISNTDVYSIEERNTVGGSSYLGNHTDDHFYFNSSMYVVSQMDQSTDIDKTIEISKTETSVVPVIESTQYHYSEAVYNNQGRGFQGFRTIGVTHFPEGLDSGMDQQITTSTSTFHQIFPLAGKLQYLVVEKGLSKTETNYFWETNLSEAEGVFYNPIDRVVTTSSYGDKTAEITTQTNSHDQYGNVLENKVVSVNHTAKSNTTTADFITTTFNNTINQYHNADETNWWVNKLQKSTTISKVKENNAAYAHETKSTQSFIWNDDRTLECSFSEAGIPSSVPSNCLAMPESSSNNSHSETKSSFDYDDYGNVTEVSTTGYSNGYLSLASKLTRTVSTTYTGEGYFPSSVYQGGIESFYQYDAATGQVTETTAPGGITSYVDYDNFGRAISQFTKHGSDDLAQAVNTAMINCITPVGTPDNCDVEQVNLAAILDKVNNNISIPSQSSSFYFSSSPVANYPLLRYKSQTTQEGGLFSENWHDINGQVVLTKNHHAGGSSYVIQLTNPLGQAELSTEVMTETQFNSSSHIPAYTYMAYNKSGMLMEKQQRKLTLNIGDINNAIPCNRNTKYDYYGYGYTRINVSECDSTTLTMSRSYDTAGQLRHTRDAINAETHYWYTAQGNPVIVRDDKNNDITSTYDLLGRKTQVTDPNMGVKTFRYNAFGEVIFVQDAKQKAISSTNYGNHTIYDTLGRVATVFSNSKYQETSGVGEYIGLNQALSYRDDFEFDMINGSLESENRSSNGEGNDAERFMQSIDYTYDKFLRPKKVDTTIGFNLSSMGPGISESTVEYNYYKDHNLLKQTTYANINFPGYSVVNFYTELGEMYKQTEGPTSVNGNLNAANILMEVTDWTKLGQVKEKAFNNANNLSAEYSYYHTGQVAEIYNIYWDGGQKFQYDYDGWGNLDEQRLYNFNTLLATESFEYDDLHRLKKSTVSGRPSIDYRYDTLGNLLRKTDFTRNSDSRYGEGGNAGPNAINKLFLSDGGEVNYSYDASGNRISSDNNGNQSVYQYDAHNLMTYSKDIETDNEILFQYGVDNQRFLKVEFSTSSENEQEEYTFYTGPQFETIRNNNTNFFETKVHVTPYMTVTFSENELARHFKFHDRMGSTTLIVNDAGEKVSTMGYDAFGKPRNGEDWSPLDKPELNFRENGSTLTSDITKRGFTDHEHLDNFELIHMNGRMYDFNNGRFLSVDPFIQGTTSQAINPYSYIQNNPLSGVDPTGYKSICGQDGQRKCDGVIGGDGSSKVWGKTENNNGKQAVIVVSHVSGQKGDSSEILAVEEIHSVNSDGTTKQHDGIVFGSTGFLFLSDTEIIIGQFTGSGPSSSRTKGSKKNVKSVVSKKVTNARSSNVPISGYGSNIDQAIIDAFKAAALKSDIDKHEYAGGVIKFNGKVYYTEPVTIGLANKFGIDFLTSDVSSVLLIYHTHPTDHLSDSEKIHSILISADDVNQSEATGFKYYVGSLYDRTIRYYDPATMKKERYKNFEGTGRTLRGSRGIELCKQCF